jgi:recyclin-1
MKVEHIIITTTKPREYYPPDDKPIDLGPTKGCIEAIKCLELHCKLVKGSTSKEVLEVFYQEIGIRLIACVIRHSLQRVLLIRPVNVSASCRST